MENNIFYIKHRPALLVYSRQTKKNHNISIATCNFLNFVDCPSLSFVMIRWFQSRSYIPFSFQPYDNLILISEQVSMPPSVSNNPNISVIVCLEIVVLPVQIRPILD